MSIRIVTDSGSDFEQTEIKSKNIEVIPIPISFEGKDYLDGVDLSKNEFFELLEKSDMSTGDIAKAVGYHGVSNFYHIFQQRFGETPQAVRVLLQNN